jgi:hypothetical protein
MNPWTSSSTRCSAHRWPATREGIATSSSPRCYTTSPVLPPSPESPSTDPASTTAKSQHDGSPPGSAPRSPGSLSNTSPAKRYLVATDVNYHAQLTEVSARTLLAQGGPMSDEEVAAFRRAPDWRRAVQLRDLDDRAKVPGALVPDLDTYRGDLTAVVAGALAR